MEHRSDGVMGDKPALHPPRMQKHGQDLAAGGPKLLLEEWLVDNITVGLTQFQPRQDLLANRLREH
ncbi:hypothetical protein D3C87_2179880 [compost metagenome]